ncbi:MAG: transcriptional regulator [Chitinophagaceae bacterium]|nr:transcriptional regulator [Chitinophagaceae bacterium]
MKILIIEDEKPLRESIKKYLGYQGYICETADDFALAREKVATFTYDCVVVDIGLPGGSGFEIIKELKYLESRAGIIIISAKNSLDDKLKGLGLGSDDYLTKPFHLPELMARIQAVLRRRNFQGSKFIRFNEISLFPEGRQVTVNDTVVELTDKEYNLLEYLISNKGRVLTKPAIAEHIWGDEYLQAGGYDFIYSQIKNLRKKLLDAGSGDYVKTVYGSGYRFTDR